MTEPTIISMVIGIIAGVVAIFENLSILAVCRI